MARAIVLGATGHIGSHIVRALLAEGHQVRAAYRSEQFLHVLEGLQVERVRVDLATLSGLREALEGCEWVFHAAGYYPGPRAGTRRADALRRGIETTQRVLAEFRIAGVRRCVFTSSASTIRLDLGRAATEQDAEPWPLTEWRSLYATVKIAMEHEVLRAAGDGLPVVITNPTICIGEYDARPFSGQAVLVFAKRQLPWYLDYRLNIVYTGDVGIGHVRAAERGRLGERYLLTQHSVELKAFAECVAEAAGVPPPRWRLPYPMAYAAAVGMEGLAWLTRGEPRLTRQMLHGAQAGGKQLDGSKAVRELGFPVTPLAEAVRRAVAWFRQHGYL